MDSQHLSVTDSFDIILGAAASLAVPDAVLLFVFVVKGVFFSSHVFSFDLRGLPSIKVTLLAIFVQGLCCRVSFPLYFWWVPIEVTFFLPFLFRGFP